MAQGPTKYFPQLAQRLGAMRVERNLRGRRAERDQRYDFQHYPEFNGQYLQHDLKRIRLDEQAQRLARLRDRLHGDATKTEEANASPEALAQRAEFAAVHQRFPWKPTLPKGSKQKQIVEGNLRPIDWDVDLLLSRGEEVIPKNVLRKDADTNWTAG
jgi:beta-lactamase class A